MTKLLMLQNGFTGEIPATLTRFRASKNSLSGSVPAEIWGLPALNIIDLAMNSLEGPITANIANARSLVLLFVSNNELSGKLPDEISSVRSLVAIDLSDNQFLGEIPSTIGELKRLCSLNMENNKFSGSIPDSLGSCSSLSNVNTAQNLLTGEIPRSLGSLPMLNSLNLSNNKLSGQIPSTLSSLRLSLLDLSNNLLIGPIPVSRVQAYNGSFAGNLGLCNIEAVEVPFRQCPSTYHLDENKRTLIIGLIVPIVFLMMLLGIFLYMYSREEKHDDYSLKEELWDIKLFRILKFNEDEILDSIKPENLIGKGASGNVYKVALPNGKEVAVKHIWRSSSSPGGRGGRYRKRRRRSSPGHTSDKTKEYESEVETLSSIRHIKVVNLYCTITSQDSSLLVYEYLQKGSLWDLLHTEGRNEGDKMELDWDARYEVALGAAEGLEYLHHGCEPPIIHRDIKSSNILLDEFLKPRIADFGLAMVVGSDPTHHVAGTLGYMAPENGYFYKINEKSDVYSFGVVLMELVTGKRPIEPEFGENNDIVNWVSIQFKTPEGVLGLVDSRIPEPVREEAVKVLKIAILCTMALPPQRPTMTSVVHMLEDAKPCRLVRIINDNDSSDKDASLSEPES
ncbi:hypothetical protein SAY87_010138 [Trapa incisa]|uniref:non-specific serine/threonine protein kinase n=1 Tax=Trapa incisa TaxID=236973 RepID=A0AAN7JAN8_9MYRT|nr:hypothetical protein SAY87_010138 [Trapa incisa]